MKHHLGSAALFISLLWIMPSCISVKVPLGAPEKVENLKFDAPGKPFVDLSSDSADFSWISETTGNTISVLSECQESRLKPKDVATDALTALDNAKIASGEVLTISKHPAYELTATGRVDEHSVKISILSLRTKECFITLTYGGLEKSFDDEKNFYIKLRNSLAVP
ncbi:MAG: hypothetical protein ACK5V3_15660 [Bdellovibrionales bacterium]